MIPDNSPLNLIEWNWGSCTSWNVIHVCKVWEPISERYTFKNLNFVGKIYLKVGWSKSVVMVTRSAPDPSTPTFASSHWLVSLSSCSPSGGSVLTTARPGGAALRSPPRRYPGFSPGHDTNYCPNSNARKYTPFQKFTT